MDETKIRDLVLATRRMNIDFRRLQQVLVAADHGSFRQAAEALSIKQSTLSRSIQMLENEFGAAIFERSSRGVRATSIVLALIALGRQLIVDRPVDFQRIEIRAVIIRFGADQIDEQLGYEWQLDPLAQQGASH